MEGAKTQDRSLPAPPGRRWREAPQLRLDPPPPRKRASTRRGPWWPTIRANGSCSAGAVGARKRIRSGVTLLPLACDGVRVVPQLAKEILTTARFPECETLGHLSCGAKPWRC